MSNAESFWLDPGHLFQALGIGPAIMVVDVCGSDNRLIAALDGFVGGSFCEFAVDADVVKRARAETERIGVAVRGWIRDDTEELPRVLSEPVDFLLVANTLHGVSDKEAIEDAVRSALKSGGTFAVIEHYLRLDQAAGHRESLGPGNDVRLSPDDMRSAIEPVGFGFDRIVDLPLYYFVWYFIEPLQASEIITHSLTHSLKEKISWDSRCARAAMLHDGNVSIVVADDSVRDSLQALLSAAGYATEAYPSGRAFLDGWQGDRKGCALLEIGTPKRNGLEIQKQLQKTPSPPPVVMMMDAGDVAAAVAAIRVGAVDFVEKPIDVDWLFESVERALSIANGGELATAVRNNAQRKFGGMTRQEHAVLERLAAGRTAADIAGVLGCSGTSVEVRRARIMARLGARSLPQLMRLAFVAGIGGG